MTWVTYKPVSSEESIAALKHYAKVGAHRDTVYKHMSWMVECCRNYRKYFEMPSGYLTAPKRTELTKNDRAALYALYDSNRFKYLAEQRAPSKWETCPYCGLENSISLDHYLPRDTSHFPHLSFYSLNIVPACMSCQNSKKVFWPKQKVPVRSICKSTTWRGRKLRSLSAPKRAWRHSGEGKIRNVSRVIHPYFDKEFDWNNVELVFDFESSTGPTNFKLRYCAPPLAKVSRLASFHFKKIEIHNRIQVPLRKHWDGLVSGIQEALSATCVREDVVRLIRAFAAKSSRESGPASLEAIFLNGLSSHDKALALLLAVAKSPRPTNALVGKARRK